MRQAKLAASFFLQATSDEVVGVFKAYAIGLLDNSDIFRSNARAPMCACVIFMVFRTPANFQFVGRGGSARVILNNISRISCVFQKNVVYLQS